MKPIRVSPATLSASRAPALGIAAVLAGARCKDRLRVGIMQAAYAGA